MRTERTNLYWAAAAAAIIALLLPALYAPSHSCLREGAATMLAPGLGSGRSAFCLGCIFQALSVFVLAAPVLAGLGSLPGVRLVPRPVPVPVRAVGPALGRAPPRW